MSLDKIFGFFKRGAKQKTDEATLPPFEPKYSEGFSAQLQNLLDRTSARVMEKGQHTENELKTRFGADYRMGLDLRRSLIAIARANSNTPEIELPIFIAGTELVDPAGGFDFFWPWAQPMLGLDPLPVWTEFANELQQIGGAAEGVEEFMTPMLKFRTEEELNFFYMAIQGWGDLDAFFRLSLGQAKIVVFLQSGALK